MAYVTGVVLVILCFGGIPLQIAGHPAVANDVGVLRRLLYIICLACAWQIARRAPPPGRRRAAPPAVFMLLAGHLPIITLIAEGWAPRRFIDPALSGQA